MPRSYSPSWPDATCGWMIGAPGLHVKGGLMVRSSHRAGSENSSASWSLLLPGGVALVGSDYGAFSLSERIKQGRAAACRIAEWLKR